MHDNDGVLRSAEAPEVAPRLVCYDAAFFRYWISRAVEFTTQRRGAEDAAPLVKIGRRYELVIESLAALPKSFVHGEFYASNVLVDLEEKPARVSAVDWELAGIGPGAIDLAALVVGKWTDAERASLIAAYREGLSEDHPLRHDVAALDRAVDFARLHLAVQWLGWSPDWTPPAAHAQDWLREAVEMAGKLGLI